MSGGKTVVGLLGLILGGCVAPFPPPAGSGGSDDGSTGSTGPAPSTTSGPGTTVGGMDGTGSTTADVETTTGEDTGSSSGGPPSRCRDDAECGSNQSCVDGFCGDACDGAWGEGNYGSCIDDLGGVDPDALCGAPDQHRCITYGEPIESTHCAAQHCTSVCDCPAPPATGDATVACGNITFPDRDADCYLSCADGETCPDGMTCRNDAVCVTEVMDVPMYGNCGNLASDCVAGSFCAVQDGNAVCVAQCVALGECDDAPAGAREVLCDNVIGPPPGSECILACNNDSDCPDAMNCVNENLCMWPTT